MKPERHVKVCHLTSVHYPNDTRVFVKECRTAAAAGYETHFVVPGARERVKDGVYLHNVPLRFTNRLARMTGTVLSVYQKALMVNADIYHFHDPELVLIGLLLRARGKKVVYDIHEDVPRQIVLKPYLSRSIRYPLAWMMESLENGAGPRFSALVAATSTIAERFQKANPRTVVINNYPLRDELQVLAPPRWQDRQQSVAYVGVVTLERGIIQMVEAMEYVAQHLQATLELAGNFFQSEVREQAASLPGWAYVHALGRVNRDDLAHLLNKVRAGLVLLHPTSTYLLSQPVKLFEYMSVGLPVIASDFPYWRQFVEQTGCGLMVNPFDSRSIAMAIRVLLGNPDVAETMGRRGREAVEACYNWDREGQKLVDLYASLV